MCSCLRTVLLPRRWAEAAARAALLSALLVSAPVHAAVEACSAPESVGVLHPAAYTDTTARGQWMDRRHVLWPELTPGGRVRLLLSAHARLQVQPGQRARGVDRAISLNVRSEAGLPPHLQARFAWLPAGPVFELPALDDAELASWLRGQLLLVQEDDSGRVKAVTRLQTAGVLDALYAADAEDSRPLGVKFDATGGELRLWAPTARTVTVCLFDGPDTLQAQQRPLQREPGSGVWSLRAPDLHGRYAVYLVEVEVPGVGLVRNRVTDPYSLSLSADSARTHLLDLDASDTKPPGWDQAPRPAPLAAMTEMSIYELHVRDFSRDDASVPVAHRGKYSAFTLSDSDGLRHLRRLRAAGLTDIHLLPVFDLATAPERGCVQPQVAAAAADSPTQQAAVMAQAAQDCFNWGYDPYHFNAPEGSYASDARDGAVRVREFRAMVQALHGMGLRVGMDVVYNHTTSSGQDARSVLDRIVPGYYHRLDVDGGMTRSTCCENTATEHAMMARLMRDSVALWAGQYRIDSFRFDLMGHQPLAAMRQTQVAAHAAAGRPVQMIGEGWNFGEVQDGARFVQASQRELAGSGLASFNDRARDAARGGGCCDGGEDLLRQQGWLNGLQLAPNALNLGRDRHAELLHAADLLRAGLAGTLADFPMQLVDGRQATLADLDYKGAPAGYASQPGEVVNYVENHDNPTLWDINALRLPAGTAAHERARVQVLGAALVTFSQGIAYFHAGQDLLRSKSLDSNSYDSGDWFNRLDFSARDNGFGRGLPPASNNHDNWPWLAPVLRDASARPAPADIAFARDAFLDLLRIRYSSTLFRLDDAAAVRQRLRFRNTGPEQNPALIVGHLNGRGLEGAGFAELIYLLNTSPEPQTVVSPDDAGKRWRLHPIQASAQAADARVREQARVEVRRGRFQIPGRSAVVFVLDEK